MINYKLLHNSFINPHRIKIIYNETDKNEMLNHLESLKVDTERQWGKMKANLHLMNGEFYNGSILTIIYDNSGRHKISQRAKFAL